MLVLTRRINESIVINGDIVLTVLEVGRNGQVRLGIDAPRHYQIYRRELWLEIEQENRTALASALSGTDGQGTIVPEPSAIAAANPAKKTHGEPTPVGPQLLSP
jgi:carbon storage regulator